MAPQAAVAAKAAAEVRIVPIPDHSLHPFFAFNKLDEQGYAKVLRVGFQRDNEGRGGLCIRITKEEPGPERYASLTEAEDAFFERLKGYPVDTSTSSAHHSTANTILINRAANRIAACTRRGAGNRVMIEERYLDHLGGTSGYGTALEGDQITVGRWKRAGSINSSIEVWTTTEPPKLLEGGGALVTYNGIQVEDGKIDAGVILTRDANGYAIVERKPDPESLGSAADYFGYVKMAKFDPSIMANYVG
jgi:hypothetical protein